MTTSNEIKRGSGKRAPHKSREPQKKKPKENKIFQLQPSVSIITN
jgi:hypothetical protein